jgi:Fe-S-cluster containining protein
MSLCEACRNPGQCCSGFPLTGPLAPAETYLEALIDLATVSYNDSTWQNGLAIGLPFLPLFKASNGWRYWCPTLKDGRCSDYEHRPQLCRSYQPGCDRMCAEATPETIRVYEEQWHKDHPAEQQHAA